MRNCCVTNLWNFYLCWSYRRFFSVRVSWRISSAVMLIRHQTMFFIEVCVFLRKFDIFSRFRLLCCIIRWSLLLGFVYMDFHQPVFDCESHVWLARDQCVANWHLALLRNSCLWSFYGSYYSVKKHNQNINTVYKVGCSWFFSLPVVYFSFAFIYFRVVWVKQISQEQPY